LSVSDGQLTTSTNFVLTVNATNTPPTITAPADQFISVGQSAGPIAFLVGDAETPAGNLAVSGSSSNPTLVPNGNIVFGGSGSNRTVTVSPAAGQTGIATITLSVSDGQLNAATNFFLTVNLTNTPPTISGVADQSITSGQSSGPLGFIVGDNETPSANLLVSGSSSSTTLVPNSNIVFGGSGSNRTVNITPAAGQTGVAIITLGVSDGQASASTNFLLTVQPSSLASTGDVLQVTAVANGWQGQIKFAYMATNGTAFYNSGTNPSAYWVYGTNFSNGFGTNRSPADGGTNFYLTLTDLGFDDLGLPTTVSRTVYGTMLCRAPYTQQKFLLESSDASGTTETYSFHDYVFQRSSNLTANIRPGVYVMNGITNHQAVSVPVNNLSLTRYPPVLATWADVGWQLNTGSTYQVRCLAFQWFGRQARPVRVVKFWAQSQSGVFSATNYVTMPIIDSSYGDIGVPIIEYVGTIDQSGFQQGERITNWFAAYPWVGDAATVADCSVSNDVDSGYLRPFITYCDKGSAYGSCYANVSTTGTAAGVATTNFAQALTAPPFATIGQALNAIAQTNLLLYGPNRRSWDNSVVWLTNGDYAWVGSIPASVVDENPAWVTITHHPNTTKVQCRISSNLGNQSIQAQAKIRFLDITLGGWGDAQLVNEGHHCVWFDRCWIQANPGLSGALERFGTNIFLTRSTVELNAYGFQFEPGNASRDKWLIRGNDFTGPVLHCRPYVFAGNNVHPATASPNSIYNDTPGIAVDPFFCCFNKIMNHDSIAVAIAIGLNADLNYGAAVVQNLVENVTDGQQPIVDIMASASDGETCTNVLFWNNTIVGVYHPPYNHTGSTLEYSEFYSDKNNIYLDLEDNFDGEPHPAPDPSRTNRWSIMYSVGRSGNILTESHESAANFTPESSGPTGNFGFDGINTLYVTNQPNTLFLGFAAPKSFFTDGTTSTASGNGVYRLLTNSPARTAVRTELLLPFDGEGTPRTTNDPPGFDSTPF
jgi:hypothetical protein